MNNIYNYKLDELEDYFLSIGEKKFKARQIYDWLYIKNVNDFYKMTNINKSLQEKLSNTFSLEFIKIIKKQENEGHMRLSGGFKNEKNNITYSYCRHACGSARFLRQLRPE